MRGTARTDAAPNRTVSYFLPQRQIGSIPETVHAIPLMHAGRNRRMVEGRKDGYAILSDAEEMEDTLAIPLTST